MSKKYPANTQLLFNFLKERQAEEGGIITHKSMYYPYGKFNIDVNDMKEFYKIYGKAIEDDSVIA
jgi:hypothetical protein